MFAVVSTPRSSGKAAEVTHPAWPREHVNKQTAAQAGETGSPPSPELARFPSLLKGH